MSNPDLETSPERRRSKFEIRTVLIIALALIVAGGLYVLVFGSPTRNRAALDNLNTNPFPTATGTNAAGASGDIKPR